MARHSIAKDEVSSIAILTHLSIGSIHSFHFVPAWMEYQDKMDIIDLDSDFRELGLTTHDEGNHLEQEPPPTRARIRRESTVLGMNYDTVNFAMVWKDGKFKPVLKCGPSFLPQVIGNSTLTGHPNTCVDQVQSMRSPGGLKTRASGVRYRAKAATRYLLPANRLVEKIAQTQYVETA